MPRQTDSERKKRLRLGTRSHACVTDRPFSVKRKREHRHTRAPVQALPAGRPAGSAAAWPGSSPGRRHAASGSRTWPDEWRARAISAAHLCLPELKSSMASCMMEALLHGNGWCRNTASGRPHWTSSSSLGTESMLLFPVALPSASFPQPYSLLLQDNKN